MSNISNDSALNADGRFGRLSYLGWNGLLLFVVMTLGILSAVLLPGFVPEPSQGMPLFPMLLLGIVYIAMIYFSFIFAIRRLHDLNKSGWLSLLMLIPLVNLGLAVYLTFAKGDDRSNQYGPRRNTKGWEKVLAWIYILIFPLAFLAAIALPAYQDYVTRAQQAQMKQSIHHMD